MNANPIDLIENEEIVNKLKNSGLEDFINIMLENEKAIYTKKGRLNKSSACRSLDIKPKALEEYLQKCRDILKNEFKE
jgi:hypothetical protein